MSTQEIIILFLSVSLFILFLIVRYFYLEFDYYRKRYQSVKDNLDQAYNELYNRKRSLYEKEKYCNDILNDDDRWINWAKCGSTLDQSIFVNQVRQAFKDVSNNPTPTYRTWKKEQEDQKRPVCFDPKQNRGVRC